MKKILIGFIAIGLLTFVGCEKEKEYENCDGSTFTWNDVTNPTTGRTWMDRNLGARQVATSSLDEDAYGNLYQWGRGSDGHQCRYSDTTSILSDKDSPGHGDFITASFDNWRNPQNDNLWQGVDGINNPCPTGYRLPTKTEWEEEVESWTSKDKEGAYGSVLKLTTAGARNSSHGSVYNVGECGFYWGSTVSGIFADALVFPILNGYDFVAGVGPALTRSAGYSIRCIKD